jgi:septum formation protein
MKKIILASGSPRRKMLLEWAEVPFEVVVSAVEETLDLSLSPEENVQQIAKRKNHAVYEMLGASAKGQTIVSADTVVLLDGEIIGKPLGREDAIEMLNRLSGKKHTVITAVCIKKDHQEVLFYDMTHVSFHPLTSSQIHHYVDMYKPYDKAGAYAIQEWIGVVGISSIEGDFYNVMGLPISLVMRHLEAFF